MKTIIQVIRPLVPTLLALATFAVSTTAQEVIIPDADLNAAVCAALQKPNGPLTEQDLLGLTDMSAIHEIGTGRKSHCSTIPRRARLVR